MDVDSGIENPELEETDKKMKKLSAEKVRVKTLFNRLFKSCMNSNIRA